MTVAASCQDWGDTRTLFVMAAPQEYGSELKARINPLMTGIGPIEAALATGMALQRLHDIGDPPARVVSLGSAGSRHCELGAVYQVASVCWRDMDASRLGFTKGVTPLLDHPVEMPLETPLTGFPTATLSTGAAVIGGEEYASCGAQMVDMETFAVLRACQHFGVPLMGLRGISDGPGELNGMLEWTALLGLIDQRLAEALDRLAVG